MSISFSSAQWELSPTEAIPYYYDAIGRIENRSTDLASRPAIPDERAIFSMLQFGAVIPPLSPWRGVHRAITGYRYEGTQKLGPVDIVTQNETSSLQPEEQADQFTQL
ncbi:MAG: hypothetical protein SGJ20_17640, partial [Planctomycetota bacterium]|nr:hypothetical protein [Planctomycetota bacterium]